MLDDEDYVRFCAEEWPRLVGALELFCGDLPVAEEFAQEALLRAGLRWGRVRTLQSPGGWTYHVGTNLARSRWRRRRAEARACARFPASAATSAEPDVATSVAVRLALAELPTRQREVILLRFFLGVSVHDAAVVLGISDEAVRAVTHRAMTRLREHFGPLIPEEVDG